MLALPIAVVLVLACGQAADEPLRPEKTDSGAAPSDAAVIGTDAGATSSDAGVPAVRTVRLVDTRYNINAQGVQPVTGDLHRGAARIYLEDARGGYRIFDSRPGGDGALEVPGVPSGEYVVVVDRVSGPPIAIASTESVLDLSSASSGRPDRSFAREPTPLMLLLEGLSPWREDDVLSLTSLDAVATVRGLQARIVFGGALPGDTSVTMELDYLGLPLFRPSDNVFISQLHRLQSAEGVPHLAVERLGRFPDMTEIVEGQTTQIRATLSERGEPETVTLDWDTGAFSRAAAAVPGAVLHPPEARLIGLPGALEHGPHGEGIELVVIEGVDPRTRLRSGFTYRNVLARRWERYWTMRQSYHREYWVPPAANPFEFSASITAHLPDASEVRAAEVLPVPGDFRVNGREATMDGAELGDALLFEWSAGDTPAGTTYQLVFQRLRNARAGTEAHVAARLFTDRTSVRLPPLFLPPGRYLVMLQARLCEGCSAARPFHQPLPLHQTELLSGVLEP